MNVQRALQRISGVLDPDHLSQARDLQDRAWASREVERIPVLVLNGRPPEWPIFPYRESVEDPEKMLLNELMGVYAGALLQDDRVLAVRANLGPAVIPSMFGAALAQIDDQTPSARPLGSRDAIRRIVSGGLPPLEAGLGGRVLAFQRLFLEALSSEPRLAEHVRVFLSDTQSPMSNALQLWGEDLYAATIDEPALVHALLALLTSVTIQFTKRQKENVGEPLDRSDHFYYAVPGGIRIVDDVSMNLSAVMYHEFCRPYHERIFDAFGGGYMHYCGHKLQSHPDRLATRGLRGLEMGFDNPSRNPAYRLESIWGAAAQSGKATVWMYEGLPCERPALRTGLIYGFRNTGIAWSELPARKDAAVAFWRN